MAEFIASEATAEALDVVAGPEGVTYSRMVAEARYRLVCQLPHDPENTARQARMRRLRDEARELEITLLRDLGATIAGPHRIQ